MSKSAVVFACLLFYSLSGFCQLTDLSVLSPLGGSYESSAIRLDWTLGETFINTGVNENMMLTQGFQQPSIIVKELPSSIVRSASNAKINIAPNPVTSMLTVRIDGKDQEQNNVQILDIFGRVVYKGQPTTSKTILLNLAGFQQGSYFLQVLDLSGQPVKTFKVIKLK